VSAPRLEIDLDRLRHNTATLVARLGARGVRVTGVTKATLGSSEVARAMLAAGVTGIGESRLENIEDLRTAGIECHMTLIRAPMISQVERVVREANTSLNSELDVLAALSASALDQRRSHSVVLMVELGDLREGILPGDLEAVARRTDRLPHLVLRGIGTNLACQNGVAPDARNMSELSALAAMVEHSLGRPLDIVTGGNSANLDWALGNDGAAPGDIGRIDDLRLGESILLGVEPLHRRPIDGLHTDAFTLVAEVIESKSKPSRPWGALGQTAFGPAASPTAPLTAPPTAPLTAPPGTHDGHDPDDGAGDHRRAIVALGRQDVDPDALQLPEGLRLLGASSDHLVLDCGDVDLAVGDEVRFGLGYSALVRAMTSSFVARDYLGDDLDPPGAGDRWRLGVPAR